MKRNFIQSKIVNTFVLLLFACFLFSGVAWGQTELLTQNFDGMSSISTSYSASGWYAYNAGSGNNWTLNTSSTYAHSGSKSAQVQYSSSYAANCYLVSAPFNVSANMSELSVSLYERVRDSYYAETFEVFFVKASDVTTAAAVASATKYNAISSASYTNTTYAQKSGSVSSSALAGQSVRVVVHCTSAADKYYLYIDGITVSETIASCPRPGNLAANDITASSASLSWTGSASLYNVRIGKLYDFDDGTMQGWTTINADGDGYDWVLGSAADGIYLNGGNFAGSGHNNSADMVVSGSYSNIAGALNPDNYLVSPHITFGTGASISFWAKGQDADYPSEHFGVAVSTTGNASASNFIMVSQEYVATDDWVQYTVDLSAYSGQGYVAIRHYNISDQFILDIDDIFIVEGGSYFAGVTSPYNLTGLSPETSYTVAVQADCGNGDMSEWCNPINFTTLESCPKPTNLGVSNITSEGATVSWTAHGDESAWQICINDDENNIVVANSNPFSLTGLYSGTNYTIKVRAICSGGGYSAWSVSYGFTTVCGALPLPYHQSFEDGFPACWTSIDNDGDGYNWESASGFSVNSGNYCIYSQSYINGIGPLNSDNWLITPPIVLPAEGEYIVEWWAASQSAEFLDTYSVYIATGNTVSDFTSIPTNLILSHTPGSEYQKQSISLLDYAGQTIYIAFRHNDTDKFYIKLDDFSVYPAPTGIYEIELTSVTPSDNSRVVAGESFNIEGVVTNNGARLNSYVVTYTIDGGTPEVIDITGINIANAETHNFIIPNISLNVGQHTIVVSISEPNGEDDGYVLDNSKTITLNAINCGVITRLPYSEYFDNDINPCWTNRGWVYKDGFAASNSYNTSVDNWLISPAIAMPNDATGYIAQWAVYAYDPTEGNNYQVYVSTTGTDESDFVQVYTDTPEIPGTGFYNSYNTYIRTIDLSGYSSQTIYIAFRNRVSNIYVIGIDDFKIYNACDISINTLPYEQNFGIDLPGCWHKISNNTNNSLGVSNGYFQFNSGTNVGGQNATRFYQYLITPEIMLPDDLPDGLPIILEFNYCRGGGNNTENFKVLSSSTNADVSDFTIEVSNGSTNSSTYSTYSHEISQNAKYIAINYCNTSKKKSLRIDDFKLSLKPEIVLLSAIPDDYSFVFADDMFSIEGVIENHSSTLHSYTVSYSVDGGTPVEYNLRGIEIPYKETHTFTHPTPISLTAGDHTIVVTISDPDGKEDFDDSNNSITIHVTAYACTPHSDDDQSAIDASDHKVRVWTGLAGSSDWNTAGNWLQYNGTKYSVAGTLSNNTTNVFIVALDNCVTASASNTANIADGNTATVKNLNIGTGKTLSMGSGTLNVAGDFTNNGTFTAGTGTVVFNGSETQTISSASALAFNNITFNNSNGINLGVAPTVNGTANFTSGVVTGNVTFGTAGSSEGASRTSYVNGTVTKNGNGSSFTFPTGSDGVLGTITATIGSGSWVSAKYNHNSADNGDGTHGFTTDVIPCWWNAADMCGNADERFDHVSNFEYWDVSSPVELSNVTLVSEAASGAEHFNSASEYVNNDIQLAAYTNGCWKNFEGSAVISGADHNIITITGATIPKDPHRAAADFLITLGSKSKSTVLPIELTSFTATCDGRSALVEWSTASERNNDYFSLERSDDAINFTEIARVAGAGNSIEPIDYAYTDYGIHGGDNYYRLVQVDYDGTRTVSEVIVANCIEPESDGEPEVLAYPNPFSSELTVVLDNFGNRAATIEVYDMLGKLIYTEKASAPQNSYETILNLSNLPAGAYTVRVSTNDFVINKNVVKQ